MKYRLLDVLACPICKNFPLKLIVFKEESNKLERKVEKVECELYCGLKESYISKINLTVEDCEACLKKSIVDGLLICEKCKRWYPIVEEIPQMLPDELRNEKEDLSFLMKYESLVPKEVKEEGVPFNLSKAKRNGRIST